MVACAGRRHSGQNHGFLQPLRDACRCSDHLHELLTASMQRCLDSAHATIFVMRLIQDPSSTLTARSTSHV